MSGCASQKEILTKEDSIIKEAGNMKLDSTDFEEGKLLPRKFTCDGEGIPPMLVFKDVPEKTKSLALVMEDPDAPRGIFIHWIVWNIPPGTKGIAQREKISYPQGKNDAGKVGYVGPCPPSGTHRYIFRLYALDDVLDLKQGATKPDLEEAMKGHVLAEAKLISTYKRG